MQTTSPDPTPTQPVAPLPPPAAAAVPYGVSWPAPHHMHVIDAHANPRTEPGLLTMADGSKQLGTVTRIDFPSRSLEFQPGVGTRGVMPFSAFKSLYLSRTIELEPIPMDIPIGSLEARPSGRARACAVVFKDGSVLEAQVVSLLPRKEGLFLFVANTPGTVLRWFLPAEGVASYRLGEPLGQGLRAAHGLSEEALQAALKTQELLRAKRVGDYLVEPGIVTRGQLEAALAKQKITTPRKLGDLLVEDQLITVEQRDAALASQAANQRKLLGEILFDMGVVTREAVRKVLVEQLGVPAVDLSRFQFDPNAIKALSPELARKFLVVPLYRSDRRVAVAMENPLSWQALHELEFFTGLKVDPAMAAHADLVEAVALFYGGTEGSEKIAQLVADLGSEDKASAAPLQAVTESDNTLVRLVNKMIVDAFDQGASDIHIESRAGDKPSRVRFRVDGMMAPYIDIPPNYRAALVSRLKIMSELDISEHRRPQDGRIRFDDFGPRRLELRVVMMPTANGLEDVVMRLLAAPRALSIEQLDLAPRDLARLKDIALRSYGLLFVCGPTGSGKTTTLHSLLSFINTPERKIWTVEDPIEITQDGLCQVQVNTRLDLTFPNVLRSFMRADPDVIMVGETRDSETARTVIAASLTGHLVFSTMHTNSAAESIVRLLDFGLDPFNFSDALLGVVGQRLVRRLCTACRSAYVASEAEIDTLAHEYCRDMRVTPAEMVARWRSRYGAPDGSITLNAPAGCPVCDKSGYKGRMGVYEVLLATPAIKLKIQARATSRDIQDNAVDDGMVTFEQDAIEKVLQGFLDLKQVQLNCR
jgi:type II secretory ATPase GspE/PulE/Tfp pilus assembly ATPase PilB-like protein